jgi:hypothetical protein
VTDEDKERIRFNTELIKLLMVLLLATGGGAVSLILQGMTHGKHVILTAAGMIIAITTGIMAYRVYRYTRKLIK